MRLESPRKTRCCCSPSSTASGSRTMSLSTAKYAGTCCRVPRARRKARSNAPLMIGHRLVGMSLFYTGNITEGRTYLDRAIALYDPAVHRALATRFGQDVGVAALSYRSLALWMLGYPRLRSPTPNHALSDAARSAKPPHLMYALFTCTIDYISSAAIMSQQTQTARSRCSGG